MSVTGDTPSVSPARTFDDLSGSYSTDVNYLPPKESWTKSPAQRLSDLPRKLNLGCGFDLMSDAVNVDRTFPESIAPSTFTYRTDLDNDLWHFDLPANHFEELHASHLIEHLRHTYQFMTSAWHVSKPGALFILRTPYGSSDDAWEDQTHIRPFFHGSWMAFSQQYHWRSDVGYKADWQPRLINLLITEQAWNRILPFGGTKESTEQLMWEAITTRRNIVAEMQVQLECIKPSRMQTPGVRPEFIQPSITFMPCRVE